MTDEEFIQLLLRNRTHLRSILCQTPVLFGPQERLVFKSRFDPTDLLVVTHSGRVEVGEDCFFGHGVMLLAGSHDVSKLGAERVAAVPSDGYDIIVEHGVWLASRVTVLGPSRIGSHSVVAAGSVVRGDLAPNGIYAGSPARKIGDLDVAMEQSLQSGSPR